MFPSLPVFEKTYMDMCADVLISINTERESATVYKNMFPSIPVFENMFSIYSAKKPHVLRTRVVIFRKKALQVPQKSPIDTSSPKEPYKYKFPKGAR